MHSLVSFNRQIEPNSDARLPAVSSAAFYGRGIFTTLAVYCGKPFLWNLHEKRLRENALKTNLDLSEIDFENVKNDLLKLLKVNQVNNGRARIALFDLRSSPIWQIETKRKLDVLIATGECRDKPLGDFKITISPFLVNSTAPLIGVKSCNYLENVLALDAAKAKGFDEALRLNERGKVVSAIMANLFFVKNETVFTPALSTGALDGTTRQCLIGLIKKNDLAVIETNSLLEELETADEIFLTSAGLGVCLVKSFNSKTLQHKITSKLQTAFAALIAV